MGPFPSSRDTTELSPEISSITTHFDLIRSTHARFVPFPLFSSQAPVSPQETRTIVPQSHSHPEYLPRFPFQTSTGRSDPTDPSKHTILDAGDRDGMGYFCISSPFTCGGIYKYVDGDWSRGREVLLVLLVLRRRECWMFVGEARGRKVIPSANGWFEIA